ncbi:hypothetical protein KR038_000687, partial [Drosophila bunnanda]
CYSAAQNNLSFIIVTVAADPQHTYDGRNGPHVFGTPGNQVYIRGQNDGAYTVPGVAGQFQHSSAPKEHVYTDELGNTYVNRKKAGRTGRVKGYTDLTNSFVIECNLKGGAHTVSGPGLVAVNPHSSYPVAAGGPAPRRPRSPQFHVERPGRTVDFGNGGFVVQRQSRSPQFHVERPGRTVDVGSGGFVVQRERRSPQFHVERPGRTVDYG